MKIGFYKAVLIMFMFWGVVFTIQTKACACEFEYSEAEMDIMYQIVEAEATGEGFIGKQRVCEVIINRMASEYFPNTVEEVVFQKNQFSPIMDGRYYSVVVTRETISAVNQIMYHGVRTIGRDVLFFQSTAVDGWINRNREFALKHNNHNFYY